MNATEYRRLREIFIAACDLPEDERPAWLERVCNGHGELRTEVDRLLREDANKQEVLSTEFQGHPSASPVLAIESAIDQIPDRIGRYRIVAKIADGGMGSVYRAEQHSPRRVVAIKVVRPELATHGMLKRISYEAEVLGLLQHPGIARIYEAGTTKTDNGLLPYFAMEFVQGEPILEYANSHQLNLNCRLELVARVCDAVHHAHQKGVIHRDLKPSNILVQPGPPDGDYPDVGQPKILDFGIARTTDCDVNMTTLKTNLGQLVGTIPYMSPEQTEGNSSGVDTRSDVYTLGVLTYQLLSGQLMHDLDNKSPFEAIQLIRDKEPSRLSSLNPRCRGDVDTIVHKALSKQKDGRYHSASHLANDIRRFIANQPIEARPPSVTYHFVKFARRNRSLVAAMFAAFVLLFLAIFGTSLGLMKAHARGKIATTNEVAADHAREEAEAMNDFLSQMLSDVRPGALGRDVRVLDILDDAAKKIGPTLRQKPHVEARIRYTLGTTYSTLGEYDKAIRQLSAARALLDDSHEDYEGTVQSLAVALINSGQLAKAEPLLRDSLARVRDEHDADRLDLMIMRYNLASLYRRQERLDEAESLLADVTASARHEVEAERVVALNAMGLRSLLNKDRGQYDEALSLLTELRQLREHYYGLSHPQTIRAIAHLADLHAIAGDYKQSESLTMDTLRLQCSVLGYTHRATSNSLNNLGGDLILQGRPEQALPWLIVAQQIDQKYRAEDYVSDVAGRSAIAAAHFYAGHLDYAESLLTDTTHFAERTLGLKHSRTLNSKNYLAMVYLAQGRAADAERLLSEAISTSHLPDGHVVSRRLMTTYGECTAAIGELEEAVCLSRRAYKQWEAAVGLDHPHTIAAKEQLTDLLGATSRTAEFHYRDSDESAWGE